MSTELDRLRHVARAAAALREAIEQTTAARDELIQQDSSPTEVEIQAFQKLWELQMARRQELYQALDLLENDKSLPEIDSQNRSATDSNA